MKYLLQLGLISTVFSKPQSDTKNNNDVDSYDDGYDTYNNYDYDENTIPLKPTQLHKTDQFNKFNQINQNQQDTQNSPANEKNSRKSDSFLQVPTLPTTGPSKSLVEKTCFVGESITLQATTVQDWLIIKWQKDNQYFKPTVGAFQSSIGMVTLFQDFDKNVYNIPPGDPSDLVITKCGFEHSGVYQMVYTTSNGDQHDVKEFLVKVFQKPTGILVEKDGDWKKLGYVKEIDNNDFKDNNSESFVNLAHCVSTSLPKSTHTWVDQSGTVYTPQNIQEEIDEITKSTTVISYLQLNPNRSLAGKKFTCKINYPESPDIYQQSITEALEIQYKPDVPLIRLDTDLTIPERDPDAPKNIICQAEANPDAKFQFYLVSPDGSEEVYGELSEDAKISTLDVEIQNLQKLDEKVKPDIHGVMSFSKIKCVAKNSRGQAESIQQLSNILNPTKGGVFGETYNKALVWITAQVPAIRYGIIGGLAIFLSVFFFFMVFICNKRNRAANNPGDFNQNNPETRQLKELRMNDPEYRGDYTVDKSEFAFKTDFRGSNASSRPPKESIKRRILAHKNANDFDSDDEVENTNVGHSNSGVISPNSRVLSPGFSDPMSQGVDHVDLQPPPPGPQPVGINQYGIQGSNI